MTSHHDLSIEAHQGFRKPSSQIKISDSLKDAQLASQKKSPESQDFHYFQHSDEHVPHSLDELHHENEITIINQQSPIDQKIKNLKKALKGVQYQCYKIWLHIMISLSIFAMIFIVANYSWGTSIFFAVLMLINICQCSLEIIAINTKNIQKANIAFPMMNIYAALLVILLLLSLYDDPSYKYITNRFGFPPFILAFVCHLVTLLYAMPVDNVLEQIENLQKEAKDKNTR